VNYTGTDCGLAYLKVDLVEGTYYVVSEWIRSSGSGTSYIQTNISGKALPVSDGNEFEYPIFPDTYSTHPNNAVGAIDGVFNVSPTGAATYSMPIEMPVGVGGLQPQLALTYNSQAGNGVAGYGMGISGISVITRGVRTIYHDGTAKGIVFADHDAFYLDGQRLIQSVVNNSIYNPESDPFTEVKRVGSGVNARFEITANNGFKYRYGNDSNSRQLFAAGIGAWYLDQVQDPLGNIMTYTYDTDNLYLYLTGITYGGNTIELDYTDNRPDVLDFNFRGHRGKMTRRLSSIKTIRGNSTYREYVLNYTNNDHFSRLSSVTLKNGSNINH
jgi:hypothetical protein